MIAVQLLPREKVRKLLAEEHGCEFVEALDERNDIYKTPWNFHFTVPALGEDGMCPRVALYELIASMLRTKPVSH